MKKKFLGTLILGVITGILITGCVDSNSNINKVQAEDVSNKFEILSKEDIHIDSGINDDDRLLIVKCKENGKRFVLYKGYRKGGIAPLDYQTQ
jgi:hypothetical protein